MEGFSDPDEAVLRFIADYQRYMIKCALTNRKSL